MSTEIDWEEQWAAHAPDFHGGFARVPLPNDTVMMLSPGPGFGDYSHPTTRLMIEMMAPYVSGRQVFDIGCGSGILSVAAHHLGAKGVSWIDIDPAAIAHTEANAKFNHLECSNEPPDIILMNMITSEQVVAWQANHCPFKILITSGVLFAQRDAYLSFAQEQNWQLEEEKRLGDWSGYIFRSSYE